MANGIQLAQENVERFELWIASQTDSDFKQIVYRGRLNRAEVAKGAGFAKSVLRQNPRIKHLLEELELNLRKRAVLPESIETKNQSKAYDQTENKSIREKQRLTSLEQEMIALKAENTLLRRKLSRFEELSSVLADLGRLPS
ncbi:VPA1267 family protein [Shewanella woodyi]|uniref:Uncharacterized protein n=1 Tax=Shewanella woodyi (strain ATCC 51908 / MS32) TaxID=392500 RepID=B1KNB1_SHEWM|nr:VPA1267 family protein [Shewanella woodyi]ACA84608.1 conserved hypothetical protein [Shewanella woodyi ATCC 51908]